MRRSLHLFLTLGKATVAASALLAASSFAASAADLRTPVYKAPQYVAPYYNWSGFYVGAVAGGVWGSSQFSPGGNSFDVSGFQAGGTLGYNWQAGRMVYGIEGDLSYSSNEGSVGPLKTTENWLTTIRGRIGWTWTERLMIYGTGGYAGANVKGTVAGISEDKFRSGWTLGLGTEYAFAPQWTVKAEYLYVSFTDDNYSNLGATNVALDENLIRVGLNYKF